MAVGILTTQTVSSGLPSLTNGTEVKVMATPVIQTGLAGVAPVRITGVLNVTPGTGCTSVTVKCRQGNGITGTQVTGAAPVHTVSAGSPQQIPFAFSDTSTFLEAPGQYSLTVTCNGSAASTANALDMKVEQ